MALSQHLGAEALMGLLLQCLAVVGVGDLDQLLGAGRQALARQEGHTIFSDDIVDMSTSAHDTSSITEGGDDSGITPVGSRRQGQDGLAAVGHGSTSQEVDLSSEAREDAGADGVAGSLPSQVNLDAAVDSMHLRTLGNDAGAVGVLAIQDLNTWIIVNVVIQFLGSQQEAGHDTTLVGDLPGVVDDAAVHQGQHTVAEHLGVDAEVLVVAQLRQDRIRDVANAHL
mmetsp:Transcript_79643/g.174642  ORF Transcript_79643/g.174642 Transcript_79643/m.174642 type:complete len:226 (+) Transcript_79643:375-1052(+)